METHTAAPKVTYVSLSADDPALDAAFDAAIDSVRGDARGADLSAARRRRARRRRRRHRQPEPDRHAGRGRRAWPARRRRTCATPSLPRAPRSRPGDARPGASAARSLDRAAARIRRAALRAVGLADPGDGEEPRRGAGRDRGDRRSHRVLRRADAQERRLRARDGTPRPDRHEHQRAAPLRRVGGDRALEFPLRAARRAGGGGARHRQHRRHEAVVGDAAFGGRCCARSSPGGRAGRRAQLPHRRGPRRGRRARRAPRRRRPDLHRLLRRRLPAALPAVLAATIPKPCIVEMGGKNPAIVMDSADLRTRGRRVSSARRSA